MFEVDLGGLENLNWNLLSILLVLDYWEFVTLHQYVVHVFLDYYSYRYLEENLVELKFNRIPKVRNIAHHYGFSFHLLYIRHLRDVFNIHGF